MRIAAKEWVRLVVFNLGSICNLPGKLSHSGYSTIEGFGRRRVRRGHRGEGSYWARIVGDCGRVSLSALVICSQGLLNLNWPPMDDLLADSVRPNFLALGLMWSAS